MQHPAEEGNGHRVYFDPPLWLQRRSLVMQALLQYGAESVLDLGCGEGALLEILINDGSVTKLVGVDVDVPSLNLAVERLQPTQLDFQFLREKRLDLDLYQGSLADVDSRFVGIDAVTAVEVVEHLHPPELEAFPSTVFGGYRPRIAVITTPNADFNVLFPSLAYGTPENPMRHWDHKFEWTRREFQDWCEVNAKKYGYSVTFHGIGAMRSHRDKVATLGKCTQMAVFTLLDGDPPLEAAVIPKGETYVHKESIYIPFFNEPDLPNPTLIAELVSQSKYVVYNDWCHENKVPIYPEDIRVDTANIEAEMEAERAARFENSAGGLAGNDEWDEADETREADRFQEWRQEHQEDLGQSSSGWGDEQKWGIEKVLSPKRDSTQQVVGSIRWDEESTAMTDRADGAGAADENEGDSEAESEIVETEFEKRVREAQEEAFNSNWPIPKGTVSIRLEQLWAILRVRQLCKSRTALIEILKCSELFELVFPESKDNGDHDVMEVDDLDRGLREKMRQNHEFNRFLVLLQFDVEPIH
ncbi:hypothetical protein BJ742DRAFT_799059 [Cladochytrium replicatum]|nr:hypothetical protein BJ742DRAFT_799059 [Cladochytrium replicatum]